ncbi:hypothetical protein D7B24_003971 [Verticillium nonalfalfae]|uniref:Uncharacterized protein n=1 Tax=Verticillium nonalfalfae TaxID=1051616 RepID=A0A3M9YG33_9PEZI|nr:uncharacterized protein D7B24_003971 [Verticillium nonalfalfae]RNJ58882.1 hypothetical protein D7B24_003971 [Verticillium nonalfalfae]
MPKRSLDASSTPATMPPPEKSSQRKTERSHEENQERAYIAASRRADRSLEARVKSAQMASEIHKKRTGKGFKITERIVQAEEMYEEEEDDMPRSYRMLAAHLQTGSSEMNYRVNAFLANRVAMASMVAGLRNEDWLQNPINKMFAESFPDVGKQAQAMNHRLSNPNDSAYYGPLAGQSAQQPLSPMSPAASISPNFGAVDYHAPSPYHAPTPSPMSPRDLKHEQVRSPVMSPGAADHMSPAQSHMNPYVQQMGPTDPLLYDDSIFTSELPLDAKMLAGPSLDMSDPLAHLFMAGDSAASFYPEDPVFTKPEQRTQAAKPMMSTQEYYGATPQNPGYPSFDTQRSTVGTPSAGLGDDWNAFMDWDNCDEAIPEYRS